MRLKSLVEGVLSPADIRINGTRPWDIRVRNEDFYPRVVRNGSLGLGEAYMDNWWECDRIDEFFYRLMPTGPEEKLKNWKILVNAVSALLFNRSKKSRAFQIGERHYDLGNDLFERMLDRRMVYTCGYWKEADGLDEAQEAKLDLVCRKIGLKKGDRVLDIGCGWGSFARFAAERYGAKVTGITVSKEQAEFGNGRCKGFGVDIRLKDYRDLKGERFDHIVSLGMFEHVGFRNYGSYMEIVDRLLKDDGLFLLQTIGNSMTLVTTDKWMAKYIFPNSHLPSLKQISAAAETFFIIEDVHNFGADYDKTLMSWHKNFEKSWEELDGAYDERFYRMWRYYLLMCAGLFRSRSLQLWQIVLSKKGVPAGYSPLR